MRKALPLLVAAVVLGLGAGLVSAGGSAVATPVVHQSDTTGVAPATVSPMGSSSPCC